MRFRTKLFLAWGLLVLLLYASSLWPVHDTIATNFRQVARDAFAGTKQSLRGMQAEQSVRMRQACRLLMNIPELRALIVEAGSELTAENRDSLQERLDSLAGVVSVQTLFVLDVRANVIAQSKGSPWESLPALRSYLADSPQARALLTRVYDPGQGADNAAATSAQDGIWPLGGRLYQVVGVPLTFGDGQARSQVEGALVMVMPLTDDLAMELARRHNCAVSFVAGGSVIASSLPQAQRRQLAAALAAQGAIPSSDFDVALAGVVYRSSFEPLLDASSLTRVGGTVVQSSLAGASAVESRLWQDLAAIGIIGLALAAAASFVMSMAITRPVQALLKAVRHVARGDLEVCIRSDAGGELRELAGAFNDMVQQLRSRGELERQVEATRSASQAKSRFLANVSHEIRTPLNGVLGMVELLQETPLDAQQKRYLNLVKTSARILSTVINDVLDFSKIEAGKIEFETIEFDLRLAVFEVVELLEPRAAAKKVQLSARMAPGAPPLMHGDSKRLQQILINLVNNAIKFTEQGSVSVTVLPGDRRQPPGLIRFEVQDTGIGIPPDRMDRLFRSFSQVDASTTRRYGGTGLGLAICKQLAELMGGQIGVSSEPGKGSTFWFTIKFQAAGQSPASIEGQGAPALPPPGGIDPARRAGHRILLAEDNEINQIVARQALEAAGYACELVANGREALAAAVSGKFDLILMDCQMPVMDGLEATRALRRYETEGGVTGAKTRRLPVIALTAGALREDREACLAAGMDGHCPKPLDREELIRTIDALLLPGMVPQPAQAPPAGAAANPPAPAALPPAPSAGPPIELEALLARCMGKEALAGEVLKKFEKQAGETITTLRQHLQASDSRQFARLSHTLKGTASLMSANAVARIAAELEQAGNNGDLTHMEERMRRLTEEVERCSQFIAQATICQAPAAEKPPAAS